MGHPARNRHRHPTTAIAGGFLGGGVGKEVESLLTQEGVACDFIPIQGHTRIGVTVSSERTHLQTRLSFPGPRILPHEVQKLVRWVRSIAPPALILLGGSFPPHFTTEHVRKLMGIAHRAGIPFILDVPGKELKSLISRKPLFIKPNLTEFQNLIEKKVSSLSAVLKKARQLTALVPWVCVSSVEGGALLVHQDHAWFGRIPRLRIRSTVGAGDSMVGAMSFQLWLQHLNPDVQVNERSGADLLRWGLAAAAATLMTPGTQLGGAPEISKFYKKLRVQQIA